MSSDESKESKRAKSSEIKDLRTSSIDPVDVGRSFRKSVLLKKSSWSVPIVMSLVLLVKDVLGIVDADDDVF